MMIASVVVSSIVNVGEMPTRYGELLLDPPTIEERFSVETILNECPKHPRETIDPFKILALLRMEENLGVPEENRGILPAVFCIESGLQDDSESLLGDPLETANGIIFRALGPAQFHQDGARQCISKKATSTIVNGIDWRSDFYFSAQCWIHRIVNTLPAAEKRCGEENSWKVAEAAISNIRKYNWRCQGSPEWTQSAHWRLMNEWGLSAESMRLAFIFFFHSESL